MAGLSTIHQKFSRNIPTHKSKLNQTQKKNEQKNIKHNLFKPDVIRNEQKKILKNVWNREEGNNRLYLKMEVWTGLRDSGIQGEKHIENRVER